MYVPGLDIGESQQLSHGGGSGHEGQQLSQSGTSRHEGHVGQQLSQSGQSGQSGQSSQQLSHAAQQLSQAVGSGQSITQKRWKILVCIMCSVTQGEAVHHSYAYKINQQTSHISECVRTNLRGSDMQYFVRAGTPPDLLYMYVHKHAYIHNLSNIPHSG